MKNKIICLGVFLCAVISAQALNKKQAFIDPLNPTFTGLSVTGLSTLVNLSVSSVVVTGTTGTTFTNNGDMLSKGTATVAGINFRKEGYCVDLSGLTLGGKTTNYFLYFNASNYWDSYGQFRVKDIMFNVSTGLFYNISTGGGIVLGGDVKIRPQDASKKIYFSDDLNASGSWINTAGLLNTPYLNIVTSATINGMNLKGVSCTVNLRLTTPNLFDVYIDSSTSPYSIVLATGATQNGFIYFSGGVTPP